MYESGLQSCGQRRNVIYTSFYRGVFKTVNFCKQIGVGCSTGQMDCCMYVCTSQLNTPLSMLDHHSALLGSRSTRLDLGFLLTFHNFWLVFDKSFPFFTRLQGKKRRMTQRPASGKYQPATDYHKILIHFYFLHNILETYVLSKVTQLLLKWKSPATSVHNASYFLSSKQQNKKL